MAIIFIIYRPGARGIRRSISWSDDISRGLYTEIYRLYTGSHACHGIYFVFHGNTQDTRVMPWNTKYIPWHTQYAWDWVKCSEKSHCHVVQIGFFWLENSNLRYNISFYASRTYPYIFETNSVGHILCGKRLEFWIRWLTWNTHIAKVLSPSSRNVGYF